MADSPPPVKPKPGSLRDRIAAFEQKPAAETSKPGPPVVPRKPGGISWKPRPPSPTSPVSADAPSENKPGASGMSASDAKASIGQGGSLKERMAALQGKGAFGSPPPLAPKPVLERPKWKPPPAVAAPVDDDAEDNAPTTSTVPVHALGSLSPPEATDNNSTEGEVVEAPPADADSADPEDEERQRRAAIAARMARLGGARVGAPPVFGKKPSIPIPKKEEEGDTQAPKSEEATTQDANLPPSDVLVSEKPTDSSGLSVDSIPASIRSPSPSMPVPSAPRRAAPPRKKPAKAPSPPPILDQPTVVNPESTLDTSTVENDEAKEELIKQNQVLSEQGDREPEIGEVSPGAEEAPSEVHESDARSGSALEPPASPVVEPKIHHKEISTSEDLSSDNSADLNNSSKAVPQYDVTEHTDVETLAQSEQPREPNTVEDIPEPTPANEPEEDDDEEVARRKAVAARLAKMGAFNPLSAPPVRRESSEIVSHERKEAHEPEAQEIQEREELVQAEELNEEREGSSTTKAEQPDNEELVGDEKQREQEDEEEVGEQEAAEQRFHDGEAHDVDADDVRESTNVAQPEDEHDEEQEFQVSEEGAQEQDQSARDELVDAGEEAPPSSPQRRHLPPPPAPSQSASSRFLSMMPPPPTIAPKSPGDEPPSELPLQEQVPEDFESPPLPTEDENEEEEAAKDPTKPPSHAPTQLPPPPEQEEQEGVEEEPLPTPPPRRQTSESESNKQGSRRALPPPPPPPQYLSASNSEILDESEGDPIDPGFHSPSRGTSSLPAPQTPARQPQPLTQSPPPIHSDEPVAEETQDDPEVARRRTIADRMAKLGGIRFGAPPPPPVRRPTREESIGSESVGPQGDDADEGKPELTEEEEEIARKQRIAAKMATMGGMRFGMLPPGMGGMTPPAHTPRKEMSTDENTAAPAPAPAPPKRAIPPPRPPPAPAPESDEGSNLASEDGVPVEAEDSELEEVTHQEAREEVEEEEEEEEAPPAIPSRSARQDAPRPSMSSGTHQSFVMVEENEAPPPLPPQRPPPPPIRGTPPTHAPPPPPPAEHEHDEGTGAWELPSIPSSSLNLDGGEPSWEVEDLASPSMASAPAPVPAVEKVMNRTLSADELVSVWGRVGVHVCEAATTLFEASKKSLIGDGTFPGFVHAVFNEVPNVSNSSNSPYGYPVYAQTGSTVQKRVSDVMPGDIVLFRDAKLKGRKGLGSYNQHVGVDEPLVGVISEFEVKNFKIRVFEANQHVGQQTVESVSYRLEDLKSGSVEIYRVLDKNV